jgi:hypothetical protein
MQRVKRSTAVALMPAMPGGGTPGYFAAPNPQAGIPATVPGYEWFNSIQEELIALLSASGITPDVNNTAQVLAALRGTGLFQTANQFDSTTKAATTAFVQGAMGSRSGALTIGRGTAMDGTQVGKLIVLFDADGVSGSVALPNPGALARSGLSVEVINGSGTATYTLTTPSGSFSGNGSPVLLPGTSVVATMYGGNWVLTGGSGAALLASNGYMRNSNGVILQWGYFAGSNTADTPVTFPIAFPSALFSVHPTAQAVGTGAWAGWNTGTLTGFNGNMWASATTRQSGTATYIAIGR